MKLLICMMMIAAISSGLSGCASAPQKNGGTNDQSVISEKSTDRPMTSPVRTEHKGTAVKSPKKEAAPAVTVEKPAAKKTAAKPAPKKEAAPAALRRPRCFPPAHAENTGTDATVFRPSFQSPPEQDSLDHAYAVYRSSAGKPTGVFTHCGIVFVIVNIDTNKVKVRFPKGPAMLKAKRLLREKYALPAKFTLISREMECRDFRRQKLFRYALAYRESDILECCRAAQK